MIKCDTLVCSQELGDLNLGLRTVGNVSASQKSTSSAMSSLPKSSQTSETTETQQKLTQQNSPILNYSSEDFPARHLALQGKNWVSKIQEELSFMRLLGLSNPKNQNSFSLKMLRTYYSTIEGELLPLSLPRLMNWGIMLNGNVLTANIMEFPRTEKECILLDILEEKVANKYFLSNQDIITVLEYQKPREFKTGKRQGQITPNMKIPKESWTLTSMRRIGRTTFMIPDFSYCLDANYWKRTTVKDFMEKKRRQLVKVKGGWRILTPLECERLQGFPDNWTEEFSDTQRYKMLGNAVTVNVIEAIISKIKNVERKQKP